MATYQNGDSILLREGVYTPSSLPSFRITRSLTLIGGFTGSDKTNPSLYNTATTLTGNNGRVLSIIGDKNANINVVIINLTLTGGDATYDNTKSDRDSTLACQGGAVYSKNAHTTLRNVIVKANSAAKYGAGNAYGGGIYNTYGTLTLENTVIQDNVAHDVTGTGAGKGFGGGIANYAGSVSIHGGRIINNKAVSYVGSSATGSGGGIYNSAPSGFVTLDNSTVVEQNIATVGRAAGYGGGIANEHGSLEIAGSSISYNYAISNTNNLTTGYGGGIYSAGTSSVVTLLGNSTVKGNVATAGLGNGRGGAACNMEQGLFVIGENSVIEENTAIKNMSNSSSPRGGALFNANEGSSLKISGNAIIRNNTATTGSGSVYGGVISNEAKGRLSIMGGVIENNRAGAGANQVFGHAIYFDSADADLFESDPIVPVWNYKDPSKAGEAIFPDDMTATVTMVGAFDIFLLPYDVYEVRENTVSPFSLTLNDSYRAKALVLEILLDIDANGVQQKLPCTLSSNGVYSFSVPAITENKTIRFKFYAKLGMNNYDPNKIQLTDPLMDKWPLNSPVSFQFTLINSATGRQPRVTANGATVQPLSLGNNLYEVTWMVTGNTTFSISDGTLPVYTFDNNAVRLSADKSYLTIESPQQVAVTVYDVAGRCKCRKNITGRESILVPSGIYIVRIGDETRKVAVF